MIKDEISRQLFLNLTVTYRNGTKPYFVFVNRLKGGAKIRTAKGPIRQKGIWKPGVKPPPKIKPIARKKKGGEDGLIQSGTVSGKRAPLSRAMVGESRSIQWVPAEKVERFLEDLFS